MSERNLLTRVEFQIMHYLWGMPNQCAYTGDILKCYEDPKPAYTTIATFLKILESKGFIVSIHKAHKLYYKPTLTRQEYAAKALARTKELYFDGSLMDMMRFFLADEKISKQDASELIQLIREKRI